MTLTKPDIDQFLAIIREDKEVRERVRAVLLGQDVLEMPKQLAALQAALEAHITNTDNQFAGVNERFDRVDERFDRVDERFDRVDERFARVDERFDRVERRLDKVEGDVGNLRGDAFEAKYLRNAPSRIGRRYTKVRAVVLGNEAEFHAALADGRITDAEWDEAVLLDFVAVAVPKDGPERGEVRLAVELSRLVDASDVERARQRADILRKVWPATVAMVDGEAITSGAKARAAELEVTALVEREAESAA